jgi:hypothetical protein
MEEDEDFSEDGEFEVETILDKKLLYRKPHFLVKWRGYGNEFNSWEPLENLCNSSVLVEEFEQRSRRIKGAGGSSRSLRPRRV